MKLWRAIRRIWGAEPWGGLPEENASERLVAQRLRNRMMEAVWGMVEWEEDLKALGVDEHFETFFDFFPYEGEPYPNETITEKERTALTEVHKLVIEASAEPWKNEEDYVASGWPQRIEPIAERTLKLMLRRGRFSEEQEETAPSSNDGWPWRERFKV